MRTYHLLKVCFVFLLGSLTSGRALAQQPSQRTAEIVRSKWDPTWAGMGVSEQVFTLNHVARLTPEEVQRFAVATYITGWTDGLESVKPECGPQGKEVDRSTVKLYISIPEDAPSEIASGVRNHLRS